MMSPYLSPNTSSYLDSSSDGVCGSVVGINGGIGPPGTHPSNPPPPPHMVSQVYLENNTEIAVISTVEIVNPFWCLPFSLISN